MPLTEAVPPKRQVSVMDEDYGGFERFMKAIGGRVCEIRYDSEGVVEILIAWPGGYQIVSPRQAHKGQ